jgi:hypothetical protein
MAANCCNKPPNGLTPPYVLEPNLHFQWPHAFGCRPSLKSPYRIWSSLSYQIDDEELLLESLYLGLPWAGIAQTLHWLVSDWINGNSFPTGLWTYSVVTTKGLILPATSFLPSGARGLCDRNMNFITRLQTMWEFLEAKRVVKTYEPLCLLW